MQRQPSSVRPSQSSSVPSHVSVIGVPGVHACVVPATQVSVIRAQAPTPQVVEPSASSTNPSQSSSTPLQVSVAGTTSPEQGPQAPAVQVSMPALHAPTPELPGGPP